MLLNLGRVRHAIIGQQLKGNSQGRSNGTRLKRDALVLVPWQLIPVLSVLIGTAGAGSAHTYASTGWSLQNKVSLVAWTTRASGLSEAMMKEWGDTLGQDAASATLVSKCVAPGLYKGPASENLRGQWYVKPVLEAAQAQMYPETVASPRGSCSSAWPGFHHSLPRTSR